MNTTPLPSTRFVLERNPYFHRVDRGLSDQSDAFFAVAVITKEPANNDIPPFAGSTDMLEQRLRGRLVR